MSNLKHYLDGIKNGKEYFNEAFKLNVILNAICVINAAMSILLFAFGFMYLGILCGVIAAFYQVLRVFVPREIYRTILLIGFVEVWLYAGAFEIMLGRECGFSMLIIATIPAVFYFALSWNIYDNKELISFLFSVVAMAEYVCLYIYDIIHPGSVFETKDYMEITFTAVNYALFFLATIGFLMLLHWDMAQKTTTLSHKNVALNAEATKDPLTGLYNRRFMNQKLEEKMVALQEEGRIFGLIICDIDNFKKVNDTFGHESGDDVLVNCARVLMSSLRENDVVCRWGGEEFLIAIEGNKRITHDVAERIRVMIEDMVVVSHGYSIKITMTFGVCESIPGLSIDKLVEIADERLYHGKQNGKNQVVTE
ncbi:MAG: GGDEF domain-containing protein [Lachnospiraceae bacterium]|nr:GGDEF domain-containing protein [Lachnospiraceae bacterium]